MYTLFISSSSAFCDNPNEIIHVHRPGYDLFELEEEEDKYKNNKDNFRVSLWTSELYKGGRGHERNICRPL